MLQNLSEVGVLQCGSKAEEHVVAMRRAEQGAVPQGRDYPLRQKPLKIEKGLEIKIKSRKEKEEDEKTSMCDPKANSIRKTNVNESD